MDWGSAVLLLLPLLYVLLQLSALRRMRDRWRWAAVLPVAAMGLALAVFVIGIATNASMGVLWFMAGLPASTLYLLLLLPLHWMIARD